MTEDDKFATAFLAMVLLGMLIAGLCVCDIAKHRDINKRLDTLEAK